MHAGGKTEVLRKKVREAVERGDTVFVALANGGHMDGRAFLAKTDPKPGRRREPVFYQEKEPWKRAMQMLGPKKHGLCERIAGQRFSHCEVNGPLAHGWARCTTKFASLKYLIDYRRGIVVTNGVAFQPECPEDHGHYPDTYSRHMLADRHSMQRSLSEQVFAATSEILKRDQTVIERMRDEPWPINSRKTGFVLFDQGGYRGDELLAMGFAGLFDKKAPRVIWPTEPIVTLWLEAPNYQCALGVASSQVEATRRQLRESGIKVRVL